MYPYNFFSAIQFLTLALSKQSQSIKRSALKVFHTKQIPPFYPDMFPFSSKKKTKLFVFSWMTSQLFCIPPFLLVRNFKTFSFNSLAWIAYNSLFCKQLKVVWWSYYFSTSFFEELVRYSDEEWWLMANISLKNKHFQVSFNHSYFVNESQKQIEVQKLNCLSNKFVGKQK